MSSPNPSKPAIGAWMLCALLGAAGPADARSINWGSSVGGKILDASGARLGDSFMAEIGSFGDFVPDASNMSEWASHWKVFDRAQAPASSGWNSAFGYFSSGANLNADGSSSSSPMLPTAAFAQGERGYLWVFNSKTPGSGTEWVLLRNGPGDGNAADDWLFPAPSDQTSLPLNWRVSQATTIIVGGLRSFHGPGWFANAPATFDLQTHWTSPPSNNADLSGLAIAPASLTPGFTGSNTGYTAIVAHDITSVTVTPTTAEPHATVKIAGMTVGSGAASGPINLDVGENIIAVRSTAQDGSTTKIYNIVVTRAAMSALAPRPIILSQPQSILVAAGRNTAARFEVGLDNATTIQPITCQWFKNGTAIPGATGLAYSIASVTPAHAGSYTVRVANTGGAAFSKPAKLVVMNPAVASLTVNEGGTIRLTTSISAPIGTRLAFQWMKDGSPLANGGTASGQVISGARSAILGITKADAGNAGNYTCTVGMDAQTGDCGPCQVSVRLKPVVNPAGPLAWRVSGAVNDVISAQNNPTAFTFKNLPAGVTGDTKTGRLTGKPAVATTATRAFTVSAANLAGYGPAVAVNYTVTPLPAAIVGTFYGLVDRDTTLSAARTAPAGQKLQGHGGRLNNLAVASTGDFTGTLFLEDRAYNMPAGSRLDALPDGNPSAMVVIPRGAGIPSLTLRFTINGVTGELRGTLGDGLSSMPANLQAWRQTAPASAMTGYYTAGLEPDPELAGTDPATVPPGNPANMAYPQGNGYVTLVVGASGIAAWSGKLADGTVIAGSSGMGPGGDLPIHQMLGTPTAAMTAASLHGWVKIAPDGSPWRNSGNPLLDGSLDWRKNAAPAGSAARSYRAGFPLHSLALVGGKYAAPAANTPVLGLVDMGPDSTNAKLVFSEGGLVGPPPITAAVMAANLGAVPVRISSANIAGFTSATNPAGATLNLTPSSGLMRGGFTLANDPDPTRPSVLLKRHADFSGVLVPRLGVGVGHFQLAELPGNDPLPTSLLSSPLWSGQVLLEP